MTIYTDLIMASPNDTSNTLVDYGWPLNLLQLFYAFTNTALTITLPTIIRTIETTNLQTTQVLIRLCNRCPFSASDVPRNQLTISHAIHPTPRKSRLVVVESIAPAVSPALLSTLIHILYRAQILLRGRRHLELIRATHLEPLLLVLTKTPHLVVGPGQRTQHAGAERHRVTSVDRDRADLRVPVVPDVGRGVLAVDERAGAGQGVECQPVAVVAVLVALRLALFERFGGWEPEVGSPRRVVTVELVFAVVDNADFAVVCWAYWLCAAG